MKLLACDRIVKLVLLVGAVGVVCGILAGRALAVCFMSREPELWADFQAGRQISEDEMGMVGLPMVFGSLGGIFGAAVGSFLALLAPKCRKR